MAEEQIYTINDKEPEDEVTVIEFKIYMHCNACERTVAKAISKIKGVEKFVTDMENDRVIIMGKIDPVKVEKKLRKKIGKRVEIIMEINEDDDLDQNNDTDQSPATSHDMSGAGLIPSLSLITMFSDENPNACSIL
ncbi:heavy metal-associated isoprenylated plant protein 19-like [Impatiens glandulifera]|uniref:heavy metal-associated isoprenylated plant protein 19-like n=1 Tax=Impatiens glandulifera TaxID=253017 RepID=UPI001FB133C4|nr:heavy metal-associated isoprenylated plant protein 19-like [Impatiens glandulifera]